MGPASLMCGGVQLFPDGPPEKFLDACESLNGYGDDVDPLVVIACDYLGNVLQSGQVKGTLDQLVSHHLHRLIIWLSACSFVLNPTAAQLIECLIHACDLSYLAQLSV